MTYSSHIFYYIFSGLATFAAAFSVSKIQSLYIHRLITPLLTLSFLAMICSRSIFSDSLAYREFFMDPGITHDSTFEIGFQLYTAAFSQYLTWKIYLLSFPIFLLITSLVLYRRARIIPDYNLAILLLLCWPFFWAYSATGYRQSLAIGLGLIGLTHLIQRRPILASALVVSATSVHWSALLFFPAVTAMWRKLKMSTWIMIWVGSIFIGSIINLNEIVAALPLHLNVVTHYEAYFDERFGTGYETGIRTDFILFSMIPIVAFLIRKPSALVDEERIGILFRAYIILNGLGNLFCSIPYSDRVYSYSWILAPVLLASIWEMLPRAYRTIILTILLILVLTYSKQWIGI